MNYVDIYAPEGVFFLFVFAFLIDYWSVGPDSIRDRLAFLIALAAVRVGFDGSSLDDATVQTLIQWIDSLKKMGGDSFLSSGASDGFLSVIVSLVAIFTVFVMAPSKMAKKLGGAARLRFHRGSGRVNLTLWACAFFLGITVEMARGPVGVFVNQLVEMDISLVAVIPTLFGA